MGMRALGVGGRLRRARPGPPCAGTNRGVVKGLVAGVLSAVLVLAVPVASHGQPTAGPQAGSAEHTSHSSRSLQALLASRGISLPTDPHFLAGGSAASGHNTSGLGISCIGWCPPAPLFVKPAGGLDHDGRRDALGIHRGGDGLHVVAIRGVDGSTLWAHSEKGAYGNAYPARLGALGRPGVLVVSYHTKALASVFATELRLTALTGGGEPIWERSFTGHLALSPVGGGHTGYQDPDFEGVLNGSPRQAVNLLVARATSVVTNVAPGVGKSYTRSEVEIVAGDDGSTVSRAVREDVDRGVWVAPTPDLDNDGLQDFAFVSSPHYGTRPLPALSVHASSDGRRLWQRDGLEELDAVWLASVGDASGDGVPDVALTEACLGCYFDAVHSLPFMLGHPGATVVLLDGRSGEVFWSKRIGPPIRLGDIDGDGRTEVGGQTTFHEGDDFGGASTSRSTLMATRTSDVSRYRRRSSSGE